MDLVRCTQCGSTDLAVIGGLAICAYCRTQFAPNGNLPKQSAIGLSSDIEALLGRCRDDPTNRARYVKLILDIDPTNKDVLVFLR